MPNSEELIKIREQAIKEYQEQYLKEVNKIEKFIMESSVEYYNECISPSLTDEANNELNKDFCSIEEYGRIIDDDKERITELFYKVPFNHTFAILNSYNYFDYIKIKNDPIYYFTRMASNEKWFVRLSYIDTCAKKEKYSYKKFKPEGVYDVAFKIEQKLPKLELPKHKVLTIED